MARGSRVRVFVLKFSRMLEKSFVRQEDEEEGGTTAEWNEKSEEIKLSVRNPSSSSDGTTL